MNELFESEVKPKALKALKRAVLPENPESVRKMTNVYLGELEKNRYVKNAKNEVIIIDKLGEPVENQHGWEKTADDAIEEVFNTFFDDNGLPHTEDEAYRRLRNPNIQSAERIQLTNWLRDNG